MAPQRPYPTLTYRQRLSFWSKVEVKGKKDCWLWKRALKAGGFGAVRINKRSLSAHRVAYELAYGAIPAGMCVIQTCGAPHCCNPMHLYMGSKTDTDRMMREEIIRDDVRWQNRKMPSIEERFWARTDKKSKDECWLWQAMRTKYGYGVISNGEGFKVRAHRYSWELHNNLKIPKGMVIRHTCDNPPCVNPGHLLLGTQGENVQDMVDRRRQQKGEGHAHSRLTKREVDKIRMLHSSGGYKQKDLAKAFGVSPSAISMILNKKRWS